MEFCLWQRTVNSEAYEMIWIAATVDSAQALEDPFFGGEYFEAYEHLEEPKMVILEE